MRTRVAVAMSGGVDSSVACLILREKGFDIIGLTMKLLPNEGVAEPGVRAPCCTLEMAEDARRICSELGVPHYTVNLVSEFAQGVILPFAREYATGRTPNPCLNCNKVMKYGHLLQKARELDAAYVATGHYAQVGRMLDGGWVDNVDIAMREEPSPVYSNDRSTVTPGGDRSENPHWSPSQGLQLKKCETGICGYAMSCDPAGGATERVAASRTLLLRGMDASKDQSYALYSLTQDELSHAMFPLGKMTKPEVRRIAASAGLVTAEKPESQEICFVTGGYREFLRERGIETRPGDIVDTAGNVLGKHEGIAFYTVGQRRGLGIAGGKPLHVVDLDLENNRVVVGARKEAYSRGCVVEEVNVIPEESPSGPVEGTCMVRYRGKESPATMRPITNGLSRIEFGDPQFAVTPGQAAVFYQGERVYAGGVIRGRLA